MVRRTIRVRETPDSSSGSPTRFRSQVVQIPACRQAGGIPDQNLMRRISKLNLKSIKNGKVIGIRSFVALLSIGLGILISAQWKSIPTRVTDPIAPYTSLKDTKESLVEEQLALKEEIKKLQLNIGKAQNSAEDITLTKSELKDLNMQKAQAGLTKLNGEGIIVTLDDSKSSSSEDSIVHAADIRDVVNLLWASGAEGIAINDHRVVINTAIDCIVNTILVNDIRLSIPFRIEAIGNQELMYQNLNNRNIISNLHQRKSTGLIFRTEKNDDITLPIFDGSFNTKTKAVQS